MSQNAQTPRCRPATVKHDRRKRLVLACLHFICAAVPAVSQTFPARELWTRLTVRKAFAEKWEVVADVNHRRQNDYLQGGNNPLRFVQSQIARLTANYTTTKNFTWQASPFAYIETYQLGFTDSQQNEVTTVRRREIRLTGGGAKLVKINKSELRFRLLHEWRAFDNGSRQLRSRAELRVQHPLCQGKEGRRLSLFTFNEVFYNISRPAYDQNRTFLGLVYRTGHLLEYQAGYQFIHQRQKPSTFLRSNLLLYVTLRL